MKTIEERAFEYANNNPHGNPYNWNAHHGGYKDGATEQKAIDEADYTEQMRQLNEEWKENLAIQRLMLIDKVWKWFEDILPDTILDVPKCKEMFYADMKKEEKQ